MRLALAVVLVACGADEAARRARWRMQQRRVRERMEQLMRTKPYLFTKKPTPRPSEAARPKHRETHEIPNARADAETGPDAQAYAEADTCSNISAVHISTILRAYKCTGTGTHVPTRTCDATADQEPAQQCRATMWNASPSRAPGTRVGRALLQPLRYETSDAVHLSIGMRAHGLSTTLCHCPST